MYDPFDEGILLLFAIRVHTNHSIHCSNRRRRSLRAWWTHLVAPCMMASASQAIASRADEHQQLLQTLGELDYAPSALIQAQERLKTLQADVGPKREALSKYARETKREWDEWQAVQTSMLKRASLRIKGGKDNLNQRVEKEEAEWLDALRAESHEKDQLAMLEQEIGEMQTLVKDLEGLKATHDQTQARLDQLYETVFSGPSASCG